MVINTDGPKKNGKFLKKNSKILKAVQLSDYSFTFLREASNIEFDNVERTIIHTRLHDPIEIARTVKESERLKENLYDPSVPRLAVIKPGDFTQDWLNERLNSKRRSLGFEDEDDFDYPTPVAKPQSTEPPTAAAESVEGSVVDASEIPVQPADLKSLAVSEDQLSLPPEELVKLARPVSIVKDPYLKKGVQEIENKAQYQTHDGEAAASSIDDKFIPLGSGGGEGTTQPVEDDAIATYKNRADLERQHAALFEELKQAARSEGYNEGFRIGEEKGVVAGQNTAGEIFNRVSELILEFEGLKRNVLGNIQQNFYELSQAVAESLLEREFSINPASFTKVLEKVLKDTVSDNEFKIRLHPDTWQRVNDLKVASLEGHLVKDPAIPVGEFKVESNLTIVDGNAKKIVAQMLQNVDMNLFEETKATG